MKRLDYKTGYRWHVAINKFRNEDHNLGGSIIGLWMYRAKQIADEVPRLKLLFEAERKDTLPKTHQQCSHSEPVSVQNNHLTCCLGEKCKECPFLEALNDIAVMPEELDEIKAWTCATHILVEHTKNPHIDVTEGFILTVDDKMFWENVYNSLSCDFGGER